MKKRLLIGFVVAATSLVLTGGQAAARPDGDDPASGLTSPTLLALITDDDLFSTADLSIVLSSHSPGANATQHYGGYPSSSPDSGTCGNFWAEDMFDRHFTVKTANDGTYTVVQQFKHGSFVTNPGPSPGACQPPTPSGGTVAGGITGNMHGYFIIPLPPGTTQTSTDEACVAGAPAAPCTTAGFINSHFTACYPATCPVTTFYFHYSAGDQGLLEHSWKNASEDRGGNRGDIRSA